MSRRRYTILDVFTDRALAGNPLAVVLDGEGLGDAAMQAIAAEFNLSETVFVLPPADPRHRAALRIFTPGRELPFAGHPTVGTAVLLGILDHGGAPATASFGLEEQVGLVPCTVAVRGDSTGTATFTLPRLPAEIAEPAATAAIAAAVGLDAAEIGFDGHVPSVFSAGVGYTYVPVRSREAVTRARVRADAWAAIQPADHANAFLYTREATEPSHAFHARRFAPGFGISEDPATGSAVAGFAGVVMRFDRPADGEHMLVVEQGYAMGRPSQIRLGLSVAGGALVRATIGGTAVVIADGTLRL